MHPDHRVHLDDAGGDLDEAQAQGVELGDRRHIERFGIASRRPHISK